MKILRVMFVVMVVLSFPAPSVFADDFAELKAMIQQMKKDHEAQIIKLEAKHESQVKMLEAKIDQLDLNQNRQVEEKVAKMREDIKQEIKDESWSSEYVGRDHQNDIGKGGFEVESPSGVAKVTFGGYMDHEFENFENTKSTFDQHHWNIIIGAQLGERLRFFGEYEIEHGGPDASGSGSAKVEASYADFLIEDWINFRGGAILVPFGRFNQLHDSDLQDLTSRPIVDRDIIPTSWTESGAGLFGEFDPVIGNYEDLLINYEVYAVNGLDDGFSDTGMGGARGSLGTDNNNSKAVVGRLVLSPAIGHELGLSGYYGKYNTFGDAMTGRGIDLLTTWGPLEFIGEYAHFNVNEPDFAETGITDIADEFQGYRLQANYHFWPEFLNDTFLGRKFENPTFTLVNRYDWAEIDDDSDTGTGNNEETSYVLGLNYRPVESWVMKLEHQWNDTENEALERGNNNGWFWSIAMGF